MVEQFQTTRFAESAEDLHRLQSQFIQIDDTGAEGSVNVVLHNLNRIPRGIRMVNKAYTPPTIGAGTGTGKRAGDIFLSGESSAPTDSLNCDGSAVSRSTYATLYGRIGTTFGAGDGSTTFNVPDFRRRVPVGKGGSGTATLANTLGSTGGAETHTLVTDEIPAHTHTYGYEINVGESGNTEDCSAPVGVSSEYTTGSTGGGSAHNNVQPSLITSFYIQTEDVSAGTGATGELPLDWYRLPTDNAWDDRAIFIRFNIASARVLLEVF